MNKSAIIPATLLFIFWFLSCGFCFLLSNALVTALCHTMTQVG